MAQPCDKARQSTHVCILHSRIARWLSAWGKRLEVGRTSAVDVGTHPRKGFEGVPFPPESPEGGLLPPPVQINRDALERWLIRQRIQTARQQRAEFSERWIVNAALLRQPLTLKEYLRALDSGKAPRPEDLA